MKEFELKVDSTKLMEAKINEIKDISTQLETLGKQIEDIECMKRLNQSEDSKLLFMNTISLRSGTHRTVDFRIDDNEAAQKVLAIIENHFVNTRLSLIEKAEALMKRK